MVNATAGNPPWYEQAWFTKAATYGFVALVLIGVVHGERFVGVER
jgi:hypothetical protein